MFFNSIQFNLIHQQKNWGNLSHYFLKLGKLELSSIHKVQITPISTNFPNFPLFTKIPNWGNYEIGQLP